MAKTTTIAGNTFLFTGKLTEFTREDAEAHVEAEGGKVLSGVSAKLNYLVVGVDAGSKLKKAEALGTVTILTEKDFLKLMKKTTTVKSSATKTPAKKTTSKKTDVEPAKTTTSKVVTSKETTSIEEVIIGNQVWMTKNLAVIKFKNGDDIPIIKSEKEWKSCYESKKPAACYYKNNEKNKETYGLLYNWFAVNDKRGLAPKGWIIPTLDDWKKLVGINDVKKVGTLLKSKLLWSNSQKNKDSFGLAIIPTGYRMFGEFSSDLDCAKFWTATEAMSGYSMSITINDNKSNLDSYGAEYNIIDFLDKVEEWKAQGHHVFVSEQKLPKYNFIQVKDKTICQKCDQTNAKFKHLILYFLHRLFLNKFSPL